MITSKQRAFLKGIAAKEESILSIGKESLTPGITEAVAQALKAREIVKITVQKSCLDDKLQIADILAERTHSLVVQVIGRRIVLYKENKDKKNKINLP